MADLAQSVSSSPRKADQLKNVQQNVQVMKNRVHLLHLQLQKQKDKIKQNKSKTEDIIKKKAEISKISSYRSKDKNSLEQEMSRLRQRNHSFREMHKNQMNNILKAVYLVKLDDARQMKNLSLQHKMSINQRQNSIKQQLKQRMRKMAAQSEHAKQKYKEYWKMKLNSLYSDQQKQGSIMQAEALRKKQQLTSLQMQELKLLEQINHLQEEGSQVKKQYVAALSLSGKQISSALHQSVTSQQKSRKVWSPNKSIDIQKLSDEPERYKGDKDTFFDKNPYMSMATNSDLSVPRAKVDSNKLKIVLKQLKRLEQLDQKGRQSSLN